MQQENENLPAQTEIISNEDEIGFTQESVMQERRSSIKDILKHPNLTNDQRRLSIQLLMDGRRRSSFGSTFAEAAKNVAAEFASCRSCSSSNSSSCASTDGHDFSADKVGSHSGSTTLTHKHPSRSNSSSLTPSSDVFINQKFTADDIRHLQHQNSNHQSNGAMIAFTMMGEPAGDPEQMEQNKPKCLHYQRNCSIISPCCGMVVGCRICHDECETQSIPFMNELKNEERHKHNSKRAAMQNTLRRLSIANDHHDINRSDVKEVICRVCFTRQTSKSNKCINCFIQFGEYHCDICNLWMDSKERPYHCHDCGICRVGGEHNFKHCNTCGMCIDKKKIDNHCCQTGIFMSKCPVCYEELFLSRSACHDLPCNHSMHWHCFRQLLSVDIRCPICKKTMIDEGSKQQIWRGLREDIEAQPVPDDQTRVVDVVCFDCEITTLNRRWHPLGVDCLECGSFNTSSDIKMIGVEAHCFLKQLELEKKTRK